MSVVFLGTSSGGGPTADRNCSALVCDLSSDRSLWMVDCAEGTTRQFAQLPYELRHSLSIQAVKKVFITHMHADHIMGIVPFLRNVLYPPRLDTTTNYPHRTLDIYGPPGLRLFVRQNLKMTITRTSDTYRVHELLTADDPTTPCVSADQDDLARMDPAQPDVMHYSELVGSNINVDEDGFWRNITQSKHGAVLADAGPILHRDPCFGFVFRETRFPSRKVVVLGDTFDPSAMIPLCSNPEPSLLIHEATDSHISEQADPSGKLSRRTPAEVREKALARGHSVPGMAGEFAKKIGARMLVLNHISPRFPAARHPKDFGRLKVIQDIEKNANEAWGGGQKCKAAYDYLRIEVPFGIVNSAQAESVEKGSGVGSSMDKSSGPIIPRMGANMGSSADDASGSTSVMRSTQIHPQGGRERGRGRGSGWRGFGSRRGGGPDASRSTDVETSGSGSRGGRSESRYYTRGRGGRGGAQERGRGGHVNNASEGEHPRGAGKRQRTF